MFVRYHCALVADAREARSAAERLRSIKARTIPWVIPSALAIIICWSFSLEGARSLWVSLPLVGITLAGIIYTGAVYAITGWRRDRERGRSAGTWR
jgi:hypothetical protein